MRALLASLRRSNSSPWPWTDVYGLARTLLASGTLGTLLAHDVELLFMPAGQTLDQVVRLAPLAKLSLFSLVPEASLPEAKWLACMLLLLVASGWRPRLTGLLHWWVSFSFSSSCFVVDGGDHVATVLSALLVPVTLLDRRRWHWQALPGRPTTLGDRMLAVTAWSAFAVIRLQVAGIYLHAAVGKMAVAEWVDGTAAYYWFIHPVFGVPTALKPLVMQVLTSTVGVTLVTWGAMALELALFLGLALPRRFRPLLLWSGLAFHLAIVVVHGLGSFFFSMAAALLLYLWPKERALFRRTSEAPRGAWRRWLGAPGAAALSRLPNPARPLATSLGRQQPTERRLT